MSSSTQLILEWQDPGFVIVSYEMARYEPDLERLWFAVISTALAGKMVLLIGESPPVWDLDVDALGVPVERRSVYNHTVLLARLYPGAAGLEEAITSQDFRLGPLLIAEMPANEAQTQAFIRAVMDAPSRDEIATMVSYFYSLDNKWIFWHNPSSEALARVIAVLEGFAGEHGWELVQRNAA